MLQFVAFFYISGGKEDLSVSSAITKRIIPITKKELPINLIVFEKIGSLLYKVSLYSRRSLLKISLYTKKAIIKTTIYMDLDLTEEVLFCISFCSTLIPNIFSPAASINKPLPIFSSSNRFNFFSW